VGLPVNNEAPKRRIHIMAVIEELIREEESGSISFGNYELQTKTKKDGFQYMGDSYKEAIDKVAQNMSKASAEMDKQMKDIPEHQKKTWVVDMKNFSLERMAEMVNTVASKIEAQKEIQKTANIQKKNPSRGK
jgi:hypothetical protein